MSKRLTRSISHLLTVCIVTIVITGALLGLWQNVLFGSVAIGFYALFALFGKIKSDTTFKLALLCVAAVAALYIFSPEDELVETIGIYLYLLLAVGIFSVCIEAIRSKNHQ